MVCGFVFVLLCGFLLSSPLTIAQESGTGEVRGKIIGQGLRLGRGRIADGLEAVMLLGNAQKSVC